MDCGFGFDTVCFDSASALGGELGEVDEFGELVELVPAEGGNSIGSLSSMSPISSVRCSSVFWRVGE